MNIFYLHNDPVQCAEMHVDKHVVKMILEYAQLLSTAHRVLDGKEMVCTSATGRKVKRWVLSNESLDQLLYSATHINHPSAIWCRHSDKNYTWLYTLFNQLCIEYTYRYGKIHMTEKKLLFPLQDLPKNIRRGPFTEPTQAMPDDCKVPNNSIMAYRNYYLGYKNKIAKWTKRQPPRWVTHSTMEKYADLRLQM